MTDIQIEKIKEIIAFIGGFEINEIQDDSNLYDDLGYDILDFISLVHNVEKDFKISMPDEKFEQINTVKDFLNTVEEFI